MKDILAELEARRETARAGGSAAMDTCAHCAYHLR